MSHPSWWSTQQKNKTDQLGCPHTLLFIKFTRKQTTQSIAIEGRLSSLIIGARSSFMENRCAVLQLCDTKEKKEDKKKVNPASNLFNIRWMIDRFQVIWINGYMDIGEKVSFLSSAKKRGKVNFNIVCSIWEKNQIIRKIEDKRI